MRECPNYTITILHDSSARPAYYPCLERWIACKTLWIENGHGDAEARREQKAGLFEIRKYNSLSPYPSVTKAFTIEHCSERPGTMSLVRYHHERNDYFLLDSELSPL